MRGYKPQLRELDADLLGDLVRRVVRAVAPEKILLFGSRARGSHRPDSDIDLLIIQQSSRPRHERAIPVYSALSDLPVEVDTEVVVYTPEEVEERKGSPAAFVTTALREGKVIYEK